MSYEQEHIQFELRQAQPLVGGVITGLLQTPASGETVSVPAFGFTVCVPAATPDQQPTTYNVWVDCDPEGNGPGHLAVERVKSKG